MCQEFQGKFRLGTNIWESSIVDIKDSHSQQPPSPLRSSETFWCTFLVNILSFFLVLSFSKYFSHSPYRERKSSELCRIQLWIPCSASKKNIDLSSSPWDFHMSIAKTCRWIESNNLDFSSYSSRLAIKSIFSLMWLHSSQANFLFKIDYF